MMKGNDKLNDKIKSSFQSQNKKAPDMLWENIDRSLHQENHVSSEDQRLYDRIKESFNSNHTIVPESVWQKINKQLNIDLVWEKISSSLEEKPARRWYYSRWAAVILLLIISAISILLYKPASELVISDKNVAPEKIKGQNKANEYYSSLFHTPSRPTPDHSSVYEGKGEAHGQYQNNSANGSNGWDNIKDYSKSIDTQGSPSDKNTFITTSDTEKSILEDKDKNNIKPGMADRKYRNPHLLNPVPVKSSNIAAIPSVKLPSKNTTSPQLANRDIVPIKNAQDNSQSKFSIGLSFTYNNSWLLNNETRSSFEKGSLISSNKTFKENLGITALYQVSDRDFISTEFQFISKAGQQYNVFDNGNYEQRSLELSYYKAYLSYQRNLFTKSNMPWSNITIKTGLYGGYLSDKNGEVRNAQSKYNRYDYGVYAALGQEKMLGPVIVGYGISGEHGLKNIFLGNDRIPARFNKTYILNYGPYINIRYNLK